VRYPFAVLTIVVCAMLSGARSFAAIGEWVADLPADTRAGLGLTGRIPGAVTIWRVLVRVDRAALEAAIGAWIRARLDAVDTAAHQPTPRRRVRRVLAVDGKAMRATRHGAHPVHLLGVLDHTRGVVLAQVDVDEKTNEIPLFSTALDQIPDLTDVLITADAMHAQTAHADYPHARGAHLLVTVKRNQPTVHTRLKTLATWIRGHWSIEVRLHWVRDVTLGEDLHQARTGSGPQVMAALRNLVISLLRFAGFTNIARALRHHARHPDQAITLVTSTNATLQ
jgi:predicted transposase YbfD/YdcC